MYCEAKPPQPPKPPQPKKSPFPHVSIVQAGERVRLMLKNGQCVRGTFVAITLTSTGNVYIGIQTKLDGDGRHVVMVYAPSIGSIEVVHE